MYQSFASVDKDLPAIAADIRKGPTFLYLEVDDLETVKADFSRGPRLSISENIAAGIDFPKSYRLDVVVKDVQSGNAGVIGTALRVPRFEDETLSASTLVIADQIESVPAKQLGLGPFVFGSYQVRPRLSREFTAAESLGIFLQVYNLQSDDAVHRSSVYVTYRLLKEQREIWTTIESSDSIHQTGEQITVNRLIPLSAFAPGHYTLEVVVRDRVSGQSITRNAEFTLKP